MILGDITIPSEAASVLIGAMVAAIGYLVATVQKIDTRLTVIETIWKQAGIMRDEKDEN
jgi:hypothetical protein